MNYARSLFINNQDKYRFYTVTKIGTEEALVKKYQFLELIELIKNGNLVPISSIELKEVPK